MVDIDRDSNMADMKFEDHPFLSDMYVATTDQYSFIVCGGFPELGWSASWKDRTKDGPQSANRLDKALEPGGFGFATREEAEKACNEAYNRLTMRH